MIFTPIILALSAAAVPIQSTPIPQQAEMKAQTVSPMASGITSKEMLSNGKEFAEGKEVADDGKSGKNLWYGYVGAPYFSPYRRYPYVGSQGFSSFNGYRFPPLGYANALRAGLGVSGYPYSYPGPYPYSVPFPRI
jgi:hypothetical protein